LLSPTQDYLPPLVQRRDRPDQHGPVPTVYDRCGVAAFASNLLVMEGKLQRLGARDLNLMVSQVINPLEGWVEPEIEGRTGTARREVALPWLGEEEEVVTEDVGGGQVLSVAFQPVPI
jgi:hypothetical protein